MTTSEIPSASRKSEVPVVRDAMSGHCGTCGLASEYAKAFFKEESKYVTGVKFIDFQAYVA